MAFPSEIRTMQLINGALLLIMLFSFRHSNIIDGGIITKIIFPSFFVTIAMYFMLYTSCWMVEKLFIKKSYFRVMSDEQEDEERLEESDAEDFDLVDQKESPYMAEQHEEQNNHQR